MRIRYDKTEDEILTEIAVKYQGIKIADTGLIEAIEEMKNQRTISFQKKIKDYLKKEGINNG